MKNCFWTFAGNFTNQFEKFHQANGVFDTTTHIKSITGYGFDIFLRQHKSIHQVFYKENVTNLFTVSVDGNRTIL